MYYSILPDGIRSVLDWTVVARLTLNSVDVDPSNGLKFKYWSGYSALKESKKKKSIIHFARAK